jgi:hypothetical protein
MWCLTAAPHTQVGGTAVNALKITASRQGSRYVPSMCRLFCCDHAVWLLAALPSASATIAADG